MSSNKEPAPDLLPTRTWVLLLLIIGVAAFALRWYYVATALVYHPLRGDAIQYHAYAWNLAHHGIFSKAEPGSAQVMADSFRDPGYPAFLSLWLRISSDQSVWYPCVLMTQALLGALTVVLWTMAGRRWIPDRWLVSAGLLMAVWPHSVTINSFLLSETLVGFLCALGLVLVNRTSRTQSKFTAAASGLVWGAAGMTNAVLLPLLPLLAIIMGWRKQWTRSVVVVAVIAAIALPCAWGARNARLDSSSSSSGRAFMNFVQGSWPEYHSAYKGMANGDQASASVIESIDAEIRRFDTDRAGAINGVFKRIATAPVRYLGWYLSKPALLWGWSIRVGQGDIYAYPTLQSPFMTAAPLRMLVALCKALNPLLACIALLGVVLALHRRAQPQALACAALALFVTAVYGALQSEPRYSIPFKGAEILLACSGLYALKLWLAPRFGRQPATAPVT